MSKHKGKKSARDTETPAPSPPEAEASKHGATERGGPAARPRPDSSDSEATLTDQEEWSRAAASAQSLPAGPGEGARALEATDKMATAPPSEAGDEHVAMAVPRRRSLRRAVATVAFAGAVLAVFSAAFAVLGHFNRGRYYLVCGTHEVTAEQGRHLPPWGKARLDGPAWAAIEIPPGGRCDSQELGSLAELEDAFAAELIAGASASIRKGVAEKADAQLAQALLLTRKTSDQDKREEIQRLRGDVEFARGTALLAQTRKQLEQAASHFDRAGTLRPSHKAEPASWASFARSLGQQIEHGPLGGQQDRGGPRTPAVGDTADPPAPQSPAGQTPSAPQPPPVAPPRAPRELPRGGVLL